MFKRNKLVNIVKLYFSILVFISLLFAKPYRGGELRTIESYKYGRFEVRMKSAPGSGVISSFFTFHDYWADGHTSSAYWNEIDLEWLGRYNDKIHTNLIVHDQWDLPELLDLTFNPNEEFHTYAFEWTSDIISFFVDDQLIKTVDNPVYVDTMNREQKIMMNIWQSTSAGWAGPFSASSTLPTYAFYDWVKYYIWVPGTGNAGTNNDFILLWEDNFDSWDTNRWEKATHTWDGNNADFIYANVVFQSGYMILCLTTPSNTGYSGDPLSIETKNIPLSFSLGDAYPNPFNSNVVLPISLQKPGEIHFSIYDIRGHLINSSVNRFLDRGKKNIHWNGTDQDGKSVSAGTYFLRVSNKDASITKKILYLK
ncbi:MAG: family 16 glycosylhydrolase [Candidatus Marinimicrobia bacterium]|nr:family 16 glycosylhydrolase [Candidatus Neomarinimicrobiota bacterium]